MRSIVALLSGQNKEKKEGKKRKKQKKREGEGEEGKGREEIKKKKPPYLGTHHSFQKLDISQSRSSNLGISKTSVLMSSTGPMLLLLQKRRRRIQIKPHRVPIPEQPQHKLVVVRLRQQRRWPALLMLLMVVVVMVMIPVAARRRQQVRQHAQAIITPLVPIACSSSSAIIH